MGGLQLSKHRVMPVTCNIYPLCSSSCSTELTRTSWLWNVGVCPSIINYSLSQGTMSKRQLGQMSPFSLLLVPHIPLNILALHCAVCHLLLFGISSYDPNW